MIKDHANDVRDLGHHFSLAVARALSYVDGDTLSSDDLVRLGSLVSWTCDSASCRGKIRSLQSSVLNAFLPHSSYYGLAFCQSVINEDPGTGNFQQLWLGCISLRP